MLLHYLKVAVRQLLKYRTQNLISIVGLGVCLLCFSICLYVGRFILDTDSCFENRDRIADIQLENEFGEPYGGACIPLAHRLAAQLPAGVEAVTYVNVSEERDYTLTLPSGRELPYQELYTLEVDSSFQRVFGAEVLAGSWEAAAHTPNAIILTERLAARLFDHPAEAIGCRMVLTNTRRMPTTRESGVTGNVSYTVQAVIRDFPLNNSLTQMQPVDLLTVNDELSYLNVYRQADYILSGQLYALLRPGITPAQLTGRFRQENLKASFALEESPVVAVPFGRLFWQEGPYRLFAVIALALGTLILLVGLVNFFNLACGSYLNRLREYSLRRVTGSRGRQLLGLLFTQAGLTVLLAFLVTGCLAELAASHLHIFLGSFSLDIERGVLLGQCAQYLAAVLLLTGMVCAGTVAYACRIPIQTGIRGAERVSRGRKHGVRNTLLGVQFLVCWVFVALAVALYLQTRTAASVMFSSLSERQKSEILSIPVHYSFMEEADKLALIDRLKQHAGVEDCLTADETYTKGMWGTGLSPDNWQDKEQRFELLYHRVSPDFFRFMNLPFRQGRTMRDSTEIVIDTKFAADLARRTGKEPMGMALYPWNSDPVTVCGVVDELAVRAYAPPRGWDRRQGTFYQFRKPDDYTGHCYLKCRPGQTDAVRAHAVAVLTETLPPSIPAEVYTLQQELEAECRMESELQSLVLFFALVCIVVTLLGVYAAITLDTERRRKEVAIRKVNGAGRRQIFLLFARMYGWLLAGSAAVAFPLVYLVLREWQTAYVAFFSYGPLFWLGIFLAVALVTALTVVFRIGKIARLNPAEAIKTE